MAYRLLSISWSVKVTLEGGWDAMGNSRVAISGKCVQSVPQTSKVLLGSRRKSHLSYSTKVPLELGEDKALTFRELIDSYDNSLACFIGL